ncbi:MAG: hypothetical protein BWY75_03624 [bacterium ADurb.Bin425]|nr:MAG: hypothetical protein BWY75_03624 [bacterium ADurb.Bin425]
MTSYTRVRRRNWRENSLHYHQGSVALSLVSSSSMLRDLITWAAKASFAEIYLSWLVVMVLLTGVSASLVALLLQG